MPPLQPVEKHPPTMNSFSRPDPHAGRDPNNHVHQVLDHEHLELRPTVRFPALRTGNGELRPVLAHILGPGDHPGVEVDVLVEEARDDDECWHGVEHREDADADHQLFELVGACAVVLHDCADAEERHEAGQEEDGTQHQVHAQGGEDEAAKSFDVPDAHVADSAQDVTWNQVKLSTFLNTHKQMERGTQIANLYGGC